MIQRRAESPGSDAQVAPSSPCQKSRLCRSKWIQDNGRFRRPTSINVRFRNSIHNFNNSAAQMIESTATSMKEKITSDLPHELEHFDSVFLVYERDAIKIDDMLRSIQTGTILDDEHLVTLMYNSICALNFLHSADVAHRNICTAALFADDTCQVHLGNLENVCALPVNFQHRNPTQILRMTLEEFNDATREVDDELGCSQRLEISVPSLSRSYIQRCIAYNMTKLMKSNVRDMSVDIGTENYRAPEVLMRDAQHDPMAADVWALGCVFSEILYCCKNQVTAHFQIEKQIETVTKRQLKDYVSRCNMFSQESLQKAHYAEVFKDIDIGDALSRTAMALGARYLTDSDLCHILDPQKLQ